MSDSERKELSLQSVQAASRAEIERWQPIETAPKDGTVFWAYGAHYVDPDFTPQGTFECCFDGGRFVGAIWDGSHDVWNTLNVDPTHWMPLPAPPDQRLALIEREQQNKQSRFDPASATARPPLTNAPATETCCDCPRDCMLCSGESCIRHGHDPCDCDVVERHHAEPDMAGSEPRLSTVIAEMERLQRELDTDYARAIQGEVKSVAGNWRVVVNNALVVLKQIASVSVPASAEPADTFAQAVKDAGLVRSSELGFVGAAESPKKTEGES